MINRLITLLFSCLLASLVVSGCHSLIGAVLFGSLEFVPDALTRNHPTGTLVLFDGLSAALGYGAVGFFFALFSPTWSWRRCGAWAWAGLVALSFVDEGRFFFVGGWPRAAVLAVGAAAAFGAARFVDASADEPWLERAHALFSSIGAR